MTDNKGFTLIEVMVSIAILVIAFVVLLGLRDKGVMMVDRAERLNHATMVAEKLMNSFELNNDESQLKQGIEDGYTWKMDVTPIPFAGMKEYRLTLWWDKQRILEVVEYAP